MRISSSLKGWFANFVRIKGSACELSSVKGFASFLELKESLYRFIEIKGSVCEI